MLRTAQCFAPTHSCNPSPSLWLAADTLAGQRSLALTIPFMASSTVEFIAALKLARAPDVLGWVGGLGRRRQGEQ